MLAKYNMEKLYSKFTPIIAECNQGQKKVGVKYGGYVLYQNIFSSMKKPVIIVKNHIFNKNPGYKKFNTICETIKYPLVLGGDHSVGTSTVLSSVEKYKDKLTVIWIDAHGDINTFSASKTKNRHGMPLAMCVGLDKYWWRTKEKKNLSYDNLIYVGVRELDDFEKKIIKEHNIKVYTPQKAVNYIKNTKNKIHISFDVDGLDPKFMNSTGTIASNGLKDNDVRKIIGVALDMNRLVGLDVVEFNPELGDMEMSLNSLKKIFRV